MKLKNVLFLTAILVAPVNLVYAQSISDIDGTSIFRPGGDGDYIARCTETNDQTGEIKNLVVARTYKIKGADKRIVSFNLKRADGAMGIFTFSLGGLKPYMVAVLSYNWSDQPDVTYDTEQTGTLGISTLNQMNYTNHQQSPVTVKCFAENLSYLSKFNK